MERLRETLSRLNTTVIGLNVVGVAVALFLIPHFMAEPTPIAPVAGREMVAPLAAGPEQRSAPPVPQAAAPEQRPAPPLAPDRLPPAPPQPSWMQRIGGWLLNLFTVSSLMSLLVGATLVGLLVWRNLTSYRRDAVERV